VHSSKRFRDLVSPNILHRLTPLLSLPTSLTGTAAQTGTPEMVQWTDQQHVRMFVLSHLCGPFIGLALTAFLALLGFPADYRMIGFTAFVLLFWGYPLALARGVDYRILSFGSLQHLTVVILWASHGYGGLTSPFLLWLAVVPLLAFLYLSPGRRLWLVLVTMLGVNVAAFIACSLLQEPPPPVELESLQWLALLSLLSASAYVSMMAIYLARVLSSRDEMEQEASRHRAVATRLDRVARHLRHVGAAKAASVARIGRECQSPLSEIVTSCKSMLEEDEVDGDGSDTSDLQSIAEAARYLGALIEDVDQYARLESRIARSEPARFELGSLFEAVLSQSSSSTSGSLAVVGGDGASILLRTDRPLLEQALVQVIRHLRYPNLTPALTLRGAWMSTEGEDEVVIDVSKEDASATPQAMADQTQSREGQTVQSPGHGLNLILAGRICSLLGGSLAPHPALPLGYGYQVRLPARL
jgi:signal transduction histidine kinase